MKPMKHFKTVSALLLSASFICAGCNSKATEKAISAKPSDSVQSSDTEQSSNTESPFESMRPFKITVALFPIYPDGCEENPECLDAYDEIGSHLHDLRSITDPDAKPFHYQTSDGKYRYPIDINNPQNAHRILYDLDCDNDGIYEFTALTKSHYCEYTTPNAHQIAIRGDISGIYLGDIPDSMYVGKGHGVRSIDQWGDIRWKTMQDMALGCESIEITAADNPDLHDVISMGRMFQFAYSFNSNIENWDVSNVKIMLGMFWGAWSFNQPLNKWNISNVTNTMMMFNNASSFNQPLDKWDTSNITNMTGMFKDARSFNQPIGNWDTSNVKNMFVMFANAREFNQPVENWDTSNVKDMRNMFQGARSFNQPLHKWNLPKRPNTEGMFSGAKSFNLKNNLL